MGSANLLEGENPATEDAFEARQWLSIYQAQAALWERRSQVAAARGDGASARLSARLARIRHRVAFWEQRYWALAGLQLDHSGRILSHEARSQKLTRREAQLLGFLLSNPGIYLSADALVARAWPGTALSVEQMRTYVARLRAKLRELSAPCRIHCRPRHGYALVLERGPGGR